MALVVTVLLILGLSGIIELGLFVGRTVKRKGYQQGYEVGYQEGWRAAIDFFEDEDLELYARSSVKNE